MHSCDGQTYILYLVFDFTMVEVKDINAKASLIVVVKHCDETACLGIFSLIIV